MLVPVLLSGGCGTRLWPISRKSFPKQFVKLIDSNLSLLQITAKRLDNLYLDHSGWIVVASDQQRFVVEEQLSEINTDVKKIILEPFGKNTCPAIALAALESLKFSNNPKLLIQTSDHIIRDTKYFHDTISSALMANQPLMTFGIVPTFPETGYGYIKVGSRINQTDAYFVERFVEKPKLETARKFLTEGNYLWNSGMFLLDAKAFLNDLEILNPAIYKACRASVKKASEDKKFLRIRANDFEKCPSLSVDYAVMENSNKVSVIPFNSKWSDLGAWDTVLNEFKADKDNNVIIGDGLTQNTSNSLLRSESRLVVAVGVDNLVITETPDAVLVASKESAQEIGLVVEKLKKLNRCEADDHVIGYRPWGKYLSVIKEDNFQVKKIIVNPGKSLSLQSHKYRSEHWVVVEGLAEVINAEKTLTLIENQSTYIPAGTKHRLSNPGHKKLILIEVQTGSYLGEDDIIRYEDNFGRI